MSLAKQFPGEYNSWKAMRGRCRGSKNPRHKCYVDKKVTVCERWANSFEAFLQDMGPKPTPRHQIDREKGHLGYFKENCRWSTPAEQQENTSKVKGLTYNGQTYSFAKWSRITGIKAVTISYRYRQGWDPESILTLSPTCTYGCKGNPAVKRCVQVAYKTDSQKQE